MAPPITIVERAARVGVLGHLDEVERLMRDYCDEVNARWQGTIASDDMSRRMHLSHFLIWLRQRQRESVVRKAAIGTVDDPLHPNNRRRG